MSHQSTEKSKQPKAPKPWPILNPLSVAFTLVVIVIAGIFVIIVGKEPIIEMYLSDRLSIAFYTSLAIAIPFLLTLLYQFGEEMGAAGIKQAGGFYTRCARGLERINIASVLDKIDEAKKRWDEELTRIANSNESTDFRHSDDFRRHANTSEPDPFISRDFEDAFVFLRNRFGDTKQARKQSIWTNQVEVNRPLSEDEFTAVVDDVVLSVSSYRLGHIPMMRIETPWPDRSFRMRIMKETISDKEKKFRGMQDIEIGHPFFDVKYILQSNDEPTLRTLLDDDSRNAIADLDRCTRAALRPDSFGLISISGGTLQFEWMQEFESKDQGPLIAKVFEQFGKLYRILTSADGELRCDIAELAIVELNSVCMVCGESIEEDPVSCAQCRTPHHRDCWSYMGSCSTFACGSTALFEGVERLRITS